MAKSYPAQCYCGCCGREIASGLFCADCGEHLLSSRLPAEERTFFAQFGTPCPLASPPDEIPVSQGPQRWVCKKCGKPRRRHECISCGNTEPLSDEARTPGLVQ